MRRLESQWMLTELLRWPALTPKADCGLDGPNCRFLDVNGYAKNLAD